MKCGKRSKLHIVLLLLFLLTVELFSTTNGLFFRSKYNEKRCFAYEIAYNTMVTGKYKVELEMWNETFGNYTLFPESLKTNVSEKLEGLFVEVRNGGGVVMSKLYGLDGRFTFTSDIAGDHLICVTPNIPLNTLELLRIHLEVNIGGDAVDYEGLMAKEKLTLIQLRIRQLLYHTDQIIKEQDYQRKRELWFRQLSECIYRKIFWFAIMQIILVVVIAYVQVVHLKNFFIQKKLV